MWSKKAKIKKTPNHYDTLISSKTHIVGDLKFSGGLHIDGKVKGNIRAEDNGEAVIRVSDVGEVDGDVYAPHIIVNGTVHGDVHASKHIELASEASINGNVYYNLIEMAMGAEVNGKLVHQKDMGVEPPKEKPQKEAESASVQKKAPVDSAKVTSLEVAPAGDKVASDKLVSDKKVPVQQSKA